MHGLHLETLAPQPRPQPRRPTYHVRPLAQRHQPPFPPLIHLANSPRLYSHASRTLDAKGTRSRFPARHHRRRTQGLHRRSYQCRGEEDERGDPQSEWTEGEWECCYAWWTGGCLSYEDECEFAVMVAEIWERWLSEERGESMRRREKKSKEGRKSPAKG
jgi:hypothetical protein